jgi:hypothetical protein
MHGQIGTQERTVSQASPLTSARKFSGAITVTTFKQRDQWSRKLPHVSGLTVTQRDVLRSLALCARLNHNAEIVIDPTYVELARAAGCSERTVYRAVEAGEQAGVLRKARHSDGRVSNAYELLLQTANPAKNAEKAPEKTQEIQRPTLTDFAVFESSNPAVADRVLRVKSKEEINTVYVETVCVDHFTSDDAAIPEPQIPNQRAPSALIETVAAKKQPTPERNETELGTAAANGAHAGPGFDAVCQSARQVFGAKGDAVAARLLAALGDDVEDALDHLACAADEADPMNYLKLEVERLRAATHH